MAGVSGTRIYSAPTTWEGRVGNCAPDKYDGVITAWSLFHVGRALCRGRFAVVGAVSITWHVMGMPMHFIGTSCDDDHCRLYAVISECIMFWVNFKRVGGGD